ncbi:MAG: hypothetical protein HUU20_22045 [Pirellulales bacterium]|nr:hypothetical protein [Pirellulales bacterium]
MPLAAIGEAEPPRLESDKLSLRFDAASGTHCHRERTHRGDLRFLVGLGVGGVRPNAVALAAEYWPDASPCGISG